MSTMLWPDCKTLVCDKYLAKKKNDDFAKHSNSDLCKVRHHKFTKRSRCKQVFFTSPYFRYHFRLPMTNRRSVILNEVKNRIVTKGNPQQRFFTSFRMTFFSLVIFHLFENFFHWGLLMTNRPSVILPLPPPVILNEEKNRIVTKGKPQQRFFTSFRMTFFSLVIFSLFDAIFGVSQWRRPISSSLFFAGDLSYARVYQWQKFHVAGNQHFIKWIPLWIYDR